ncbi:MAG: hypothetical protein QNJ97_15055 [Myxococcota bacterium]|nr:hypothetical protein [Myxococcota bacterium]
MKNDNRRSSQPGPPPIDKSPEDSSIFEKVMPESIKRGVETLLREGRLKSLLGDLKLPKEIIAHIVSTVDETKHAVLNVVGKEVRLFLEHTNFSDELAKLLTQVSFEVKTQVRFIPSEQAIKNKEDREDLQDDDIIPEPVDPEADPEASHT